MCLAKRDTLRGEIVGDFGSDERRVLRRRAQARFAEFRGGESCRGDFHHGQRLIVRGEQRFLILLQVALITRGQALRSSKQRDERAVNAAGLAADQFPCIGVFLLRHQAAAGGVFVGQLDEAEFGRGEKNHVLGEPRKMHRQRGERKESFEREIAVADGVEAIGGDARKAEIARERLAVERKRTAGERAGAHRANIRAGGSGCEAFGVALKSFAVREQPVRKQQRLGMLHVRGARHGNAEIGFGLHGNRAGERAEGGAQLARGVLHVHAKFGRNHFVAAAAGVELGAERAELFDQRRFGEMVDVFGPRGIEPGGVGLRARFDFIERGDDALGLVVGKNSRGGDGAGPGAVERKLLRQHPAIERPGALEFVEGGVGRAFEHAAPHFLVLAVGNGHLTAASSGTVMGRAKRLMKPSASFGL